MINWLTRLFPLWALTFALIAYVYPHHFSSLKTAIIPLLTVVMFGMGMTLTLSDFKKIFASPGVICTGVFLQYFVMPLSAFLICKSLNLSAPLSAGIVLVGCSPGGTASNVICYLAKGNVALSITLTLASTLLAVLVTPSLTWLYLHQIIPVPFWNMLLSVLQIVLVPVIIGTAINTLWGPRLRKIIHVFPFVSTLAIVLIIAIVVGLNKSKLLDVGLIIIGSVILHNLIGLLCGYWLPKLLGYDTQTCRTLSIEVGMQNSGLSVALATKYFTATAAIPGALFSVWHNLSGSVLAGYWNSRSRKK
jgi:BASS family bile acid:Na+ symporter